MPYDYPPRNPMSRATKMRGQTPERDSSPTMQMSRAQQQAVLTGSVAILWDMENCPVPTDVKADDVAGNVRMALRLHPVIQGAVTFFSAYGDFNHFQRKVREGCQRTGVNLIDVPNGKKDASDKAILVDLFLFALDNRPPCTIFLISGDVDFAPALHKLGQRGYTIALAIPSGVGVSSALFSAGRFVWDWPTAARGGGLVPAKSFSFKGGSADDRIAEIISSTRGSVGVDDKMAETISSSRVSIDDRVVEIIPSSRGGRGVVDNRVPEIIELNGYAGHAGPAWGPSDDSDLASDDPITPYDDEKIVWKSAPIPRRYVDHPSADGVARGSKFDIAPRMTVGSSPARHSTSSGKPPQAVHPLAPLATREPGNHATRERGNHATVARDMSSSTVRTQADPTGSTVAKGSSSNPATQTGNLQQDLKTQLVTLLSLHSGKLEYSRVPIEYQKLYGRPLYLAEYGSTGTKLENLLERERLREWIFTRGEGANKILHFTKTGSRLAAKLKRDAKTGRGAPREEAEVGEPARIQTEDSIDPGEETGDEIVFSIGAKKSARRSVEEFQTMRKSEKESQKSEGESSKDLEGIQVPVYDWGFGSAGSGGSGDENDNDQQEGKDVEVDESTLEQVVKSEGSRRVAGSDILGVFRVDLQELLVSHACKIPVQAFVKLYEQRYSRDLDPVKFGVQDLESLIKKVSDVAVMMVESGSNDKFLVASSRLHGKGFG